MPKKRRQLKQTTHQPLRQTTQRASYNREATTAKRLHNQEKASIRQQYRVTPKIRKGRRRYKEVNLFTAVIFPVIWWCIKKIFAGIKWLLKYVHGKWVSRNAIQSLQRQH